MDQNSFSIMTWNLYYGADLTPLFGSSPEQIPVLVTEVFRQFLATNMPARAQAIARVICNNAPDIIGLQEAAKWTLTIPNYRIIEYDFIKLLLCELEKLGMYYQIAALNFNFSQTLPSSNSTLISLEDRDVILVRTCGRICVLDDQRSNFTTNSTIPVGNQSVTITQGWSYIDACLNGVLFRTVNTHLDAASSQIRQSQLNELLTGPANTSLPLFFIGDFNSNASTNDIGYQTLLSAGFQDTFTAAGIGTGFTAHHDSDLLTAESALTTRLDLILYKNASNLVVCSANVVGASQEDRTCAGLWPSDHAAVIARLAFLT